MYSKNLFIFVLRAFIHLPYNFTDKRRDNVLNRIYLSLTFILYIYYTHTHTQVYSYISVIWSKTTFICVLSEFYGVSL